MADKLYFASDYMEGAHPAVLQALERTNMLHTIGYGQDEVTEAVREKLRALCGCPGAEIHFLTGGTQTNQIVIDTLLRPWQGVIASAGGHVAVHEAGAIEFSGHKVLALPHVQGKLQAEDIRRYVADFKNDANWEHIVEPGMVYISQPTEYGTLYSLAELREISAACHEFGLPLYVDGARLACALGAPQNDVSLQQLAECADAFYIGGTKCGCLYGEALVITREGLIPRLFTQLKQHGAMLAKGRIPAVQFDALFTGGLYVELGKHAVLEAARIAEALSAAGFQLYMDAQTNQIFAVMENSMLPALDEQVVYSFIEKYDDTHTVVRFCTSWATAQQDVDALIKIIARLGQGAK